MTKPMTQAERMVRIETLFESLITEKKLEIAAIKDLRDDVRLLSAKMDDEVAKLNLKQTATDAAITEARSTIKGFGAGMAATFTLIGAGISAGIGHLMGFFK